MYGNGYNNNQTIILEERGYGGYGRQPEVVVIEQNRPAIGLPVYYNGYNNGYANQYNNGYVNGGYGQNYQPNYGVNQVVIVDEGPYYRRNRGCCLLTFIFVFIIIALFNSLYWTLWY